MDEEMQEEEVGCKETFNRRYIFVHALGNGGQGGVFRYKRRDSGELVVVKEFGALTSREWSMLRAVQHPHICSLVDRVRYENRIVKVTKIVVESMDSNVFSLMMKDENRKRLDPDRDKLPVDSARVILYCVALALDYLHHKLIVHLDVKPQNILIRKDPDASGNGHGIRLTPDGRPDIKLADFGLACYLGGDGEAPASFCSVGTQRFMAPEVEKDSRYGVKADVYSLGVVLHFMLTARFPKTGFHQPAELHPDLPEDNDLRHLLEGMLHGDSYQRPYMHQVLCHPWLADLRRAGDTMLGDLRESQAGSKVLLLQVRRESVDAGQPLSLARGVLTPNPPLPIFICYMDLSEINAPNAAVVVCTNSKPLETVHKGQCCTLAAIMQRNGMSSTDEFSSIFEACPPHAASTTDMLLRVVKKDGQPFGYLRSLWVLTGEANTNQQKYVTGSDPGLHLSCARSGRVIVWRSYQALRQHIVDITGLEGGTHLYLPMFGCDSKLDGFSSIKAQRQFVTQEAVGFVQHCAEVMSGDALELVTLYTWQKDSLSVLMEFMRSFRKEFHGVIPARLDEVEYRRCVQALQDAQGANAALRMDNKLQRLLQELEALNTHSAVCDQCWVAGDYVEKQFGSLSFSNKPLHTKMDAALEVLDYNREKCCFDAETAKIESNTWVSTVSHFDSIRSLHALLSILRIAT